MLIDLPQGTGIDSSGIMPDLHPVWDQNQARHLKS